MGNLAMFAQALGRGVVRADLEAGEMLQAGEVHGARVGEGRVGEHERFEIRAVRAELREPFVIDLAPAEARIFQRRPAGEILERVPGDHRADEAEAIELLEPGEMGEAFVVELRLVGDVEKSEAAQIGDGEEVVVLRGGVEDGERLQVDDMAEVLVEGVVEGIRLALRFDAERGTAEVGHAQCLEERQVSAEGLLQPGRCGVDFLERAGRFFQQRDDGLDVRLLVRRGEDVGRVSLEGGLFRGIAGGGDGRIEIGLGGDGREAGGRLSEDGGRQDERAEQRELEGGHGCGQWRDEETIRQSGGWESS